MSTYSLESIYFIFYISFITASLTEHNNRGWYTTKNERNSIIPFITFTRAIFSNSADSALRFGR